MDTPSRRDRHLGLIAAISTISVAAIAFGHSLPLFSIFLEKYGASDQAIGLNAGMAALGAIVVTPFFPRLIKPIGLKLFLALCLCLMILTYAGFALVGDRLWLWYPLRFLFGIGGAGLFVGSEIWINALATRDTRGRIIGMYSTFLALGFAAGPQLVEWGSTIGAIPFLIGGSVFATASLPILLAPAPPVDSEERPPLFGAITILAKAPATFAAAAIFAGAEAAILTFLPVYAIEEALGADLGARAITVYGLGLVTFQYALGRLADRIGHRRGLLLCAGVSLAGAAGFVAIGPTLSLLFPLLFVWGGFLAGIYTMGLTLLGDSFGGKDLAAANTGYVFSYGLGAIIGPVGAGLSRSAFGQTGLEVFLLALLLGYAALVWRRRRSTAP
ncbi:hypothetical protein PB2503_09104 [Parvularcula bermudensis HTCC2503]|uniref:Major facilitator superfamily (MFS) profile domain-containing protein n=2 Tax=Parvularcula TaxID=208215 RepID=E0TCT5_PARBH|nr:hypothetical protein PB2503_09104 [Parvularcula bermudensis HTCC2503]